MPDITPEMIKALYTLRNQELTTTIGRLEMVAAVNVLDNAGFFAAIDEATGYDVDPAPEWVSKCNCTPARSPWGYVTHQEGCPGDPAEWGDFAFTMAPKTNWLGQGPDQG